MTDDDPGGGVWRVEVSSPAHRALQRLPEKVAVAVVEFITGTLPSDPYRMSKPLHAPLQGWRVARRGDYRVILEILEDDGVLHIGGIDHRADAYRTSSMPPRRGIDQ